MKNIIVRLSIFGISLYFVAVLIAAWCGIEISDNVFIRLPLEYILYHVAKNEPKYNCRYARFLALSIFMTELFSTLDVYFGIVPDAYVYLSILSLFWIVSIIATIVLSIRHFNKVRRLRKDGNKEAAEYKLR